MITIPAGKKKAELLKLYEEMKTYIENNKGKENTDTFKAHMKMLFSQREKIYKRS